MIRYPCKKDGKDCEKRHPACQSECEEFLEVQARNRAARDALKRERIADAIVAGGASKRAGQLQYRRRKSILMKGWK